MSRRSGDGANPNQGRRACDSVNFSDHFADEKRVSYRRQQLDMVHELVWDGENPELSHLTIELCKELTGANFVNSSPAGASIGDDGSTGL